MTEVRAKGPVLAIDSCGRDTTLALAWVAGGRLEHPRERTLAPRTAGSLLTRALRELLGESSVAELSAVVVVRGPGSFTGMRIGLSTAKALAEACALPLLSASRLAVLAEKSGAKQVALYAGRGSVYLRTARAVPGQAQSAMEQLLTAEEARRVIAASAAGKGGEQALTVCEERVLALFPKARMVDEPTAANALRHALPRLLAGEREDTATLDALYLWRESEMLGQAAPGRAAAG